jgi:cation transport ATPase
MPQSGNLYDILGLKRYASIDEVRTKFRKLAVKYHPDKNPDNPEVEELFKQMVAAYNVLSDEDKKRNYDLKLSGFYTYHKVETEEEKKAKRRERVKQIRKRMKEKEEREIKQAYDEANQQIPYKWRYVIAIVTTILSLSIILSNWYIYDVMGVMETAFFKMFFAYALSLYVVVFFLKSLFLKWNAENIKKPFSFNIRNRISIFFLLYIFLMINFSANAPEYYKQFHLSSFGETTVGVYQNSSKKNTGYLIYDVDGERIIKYVYTEGQNIWLGEIEVIIRYSSVNPYIAEIEGFNDALEL